VLFFPATATDGNNYNKGHLNCPFLPVTELVDRQERRAEHRAAEHADRRRVHDRRQEHGNATAKGIVIDDRASRLPLERQVSVSADDASVTWMLVGTNPLQVKVPVASDRRDRHRPISGRRQPHCASTDFTNVATASGVNAMEVSGQRAPRRRRPRRRPRSATAWTTTATARSTRAATPSATTATVCNGVETCGGASGCHAGTPLACDDGNACTADTCDAQLGCVHVP
jgi:hypothetical protein